jgi:hypothetical protein
MEVYPPTFAANSFARSIEEARTAAAIVFLRHLDTVALLEGVVDVFEDHRLNVSLLKHRNWSARRIAYGGSSTSLPEGGPIELRHGGQHRHSLFPSG